MFKTRKVIAEIFSIAGAISQQCTSNLLSGGHWETIEPAPSTGLESSHSHSEAGEVCMPHYEFVCNACKKTFLTILTIAERGKDCLPALRQSRGTTEVVCLLGHHLEEEHLNTARYGGSSALRQIFLRRPRNRRQHVRAGHGNRPRRNPQT